MADTPLLDELAALGDVGVRLVNACQAVVDGVWAEHRALQAERRRELLDRRVALFFADHPDASANAVRAAVGGTRADVLAAVKRLRSAVRPEPNQAAA